MEVDIHFTTFNLKKMKTSKKIIIGLIAITAAGAATLSSVFAYKGDPSVKGPNYSEERHTEMEKAFTNNDYEAWKKLMDGKGRVTEVVNADNFARFSEAHKLAEEGKIDESKAIRTELGLNLKDGSGKNQGQRNGQQKGFRNNQNPQCETPNTTN